MPKRIVTLFLLAFLCALPARAQEALTFSTPTDNYREKQVMSFLEDFSDGVAPWFLAKTDLNGDGLDEFLARQTGQKCTSAPFCPHYVVAFRNDTPTLISQFYARKVLISDKKTYGIRQILVYNHPHNDFRAETYVWTPRSFRFEPETPENSQNP